MRITSNMITQKYIKQLSSMESSLNDSTDKVTSGNAMTSFSDNTTASVRAYKIRSTLNQIDSYMSNISHADTYLTDAESALNNVEDIYQYAMSKIVQGQNSTMSDEEKSIVATQLRSLQGELLSTLNTNVTGTYLFGGTTVESEPFTIDSTTGKLMYNGYVLDDLDSSDPADADIIKQLSNDSRNLNLGLNLQFDSSDELVNSSAFAYTIQGINFVGYGTSGATVTINGTSSAVSGNLYDLLGQIADSFESSDYSYAQVDTLYSQFQSVSGGISQSLTTVGAKQNYLEFMTDRYTTQKSNLEDKQSLIEDVDLPTAIIEYKTNEVAYNAALQMGANVIQNSIFDYMS
jgi:Flagellin and related hook-associated proteins